MSATIEQLQETVRKLEATMKDATIAIERATRVLKYIQAHYPQVFEEAKERVDGLR